MSRTKRVAACCALAVVVVANARPLSIPGAGAVRVGDDPNRATPFIAALATHDPVERGQAFGACYEPWLSSYMEGNIRPIVRMMRCATQRWPVPGGLDKTMAVVGCESSFNPLNINTSGTHFGLFQHDGRYWRDRWREWGTGIDFQVPNNPLDAWASIMVSVRIVNRYGWSAWACS